MEAEARLVNLSRRAGKLAGGRGGAKESGDLRTPQEIDDENEQNQVRGGLFEGVERADANVQSKPGNEDPTSPVVADEKKNSAHDSEEAEQEDENGHGANRLGAQLIEMVNEAEEVGGDEENGEDPNGEGAGSHYGEDCSMASAASETKSETRNGKSKSRPDRANPDPAWQVEGEFPRTV